MNRFPLLAVATFGLATITPSVWGHGDADPIISLFSVNQLEQVSSGDESELNWDVDAWLGKDLDKLWLKTSGNYRDGARQSSEVEILYSKGVSTYWDLQTGWRGDFTEQQNQHWFAFGLQGLAPYFFETSVTLYLGEGGQTALRFDTEYEFLFTQKLILSPEFEVNIHGRNDKQSGTGSGLSEVETGLRLRYEFTRKFAPYVGLSYHKEYGQTADYSSESGRHTEVLSWLFGLYFWW